MKSFVCTLQVLTYCGFVVSYAAQRFALLLDTRSVLHPSVVCTILFLNFLNYFIFGIALFLLRCTCTLCCCYVNSYKFLWFSSLSLDSLQLSLQSLLTCSAYPFALHTRLSVYPFEFTFSSTTKLM